MSLFISSSENGTTLCYPSSLSLATLIAMAENQDGGTDSNLNMFHHGAPVLVDGHSNQGNQTEAGRGLSLVPFWGLRIVELMMESVYMVYPCNIQVFS